jgi:organic hydroperoxide reductase OsmC/OhrA
MKHINRKVKVEHNVLETINRRKANWICHILHGNCHLKHAIQGNIEERIKVMER